MIIFDETNLPRNYTLALILYLANKMYRKSIFSINYYFDLRHSDSFCDQWTTHE